MFIVSVLQSEMRQRFNVEHFVPITLMYFEEIQSGHNRENTLLQDTIVSSDKLIISSKMQLCI